VAVRQASLDRDSSLVSTSIDVGGALVRSDVGARLDGEGGHVSLNGLYLTDGRRHVDNQIRVHHAKPHCTSQQLYKGILDGRSRAVFNGRIVVDPGAQKTNAEQSNRNLLLSDGALVHSNPQLEILADDVRCTHGSTVGRLDEDALFYLRSRGIDRAAAESLLTYAFAAEVVGRIQPEAVRTRLEEYLFARLPRGELIREAV
jgi:Fe-S cluster assembly protein SufD